MPLVYQNDFSEESGNCVPSCIASAFSLDLDDVPHFLKQHGDGWLKACNKWLHEKLGYTLVFLEPKEAAPILKVISNIPYFLIGEVGKSEYHMCLGFNGNLIHDPNPAGSGLRLVKDYVFLLNTRLRAFPVQWVFSPSHYQESHRMGICVQEDCRVMTTSRIYEHTLTTQRRHFLCGDCLSKFRFNDGEILVEPWQR